MSRVRFTLPQVKDCPDSRAIGLSTLRQRLAEPT